MKVIETIDNIDFIYEKKKIIMMIKKKKKRLQKIYMQILLKLN